MADHTLKRVLDAGIHFTALTQAKAEEIVKAHIAAQPALMAIPANERQAAHTGV